MNNGFDLTVCLKFQIARYEPWRLSYIRLRLGQATWMDLAVCRTGPRHWL